MSAEAKFSYLLCRHSPSSESLGNLPGPWVRSWGLWPHLWPWPWVPRLCKLREFLQGQWCRPFYRSGLSHQCHLEPPSPTEEQDQVYVAVYKDQLCILKVFKNLCLIPFVDLTIKYIHIIWIWNQSLNVKTCSQFVNNNTWPFAYMEVQRQSGLAVTDKTNLFFLNQDSL